jgi:hypothetical protein
MISSVRYIFRGRLDAVKLHGSGCWRLVLCKYTER